MNISFIQLSTSRLLSRIPCAKEPARSQSTYFSSYKPDFSTSRTQSPHGLSIVFSPCCLHPLSSCSFRYCGPSSTTFPFPSSFVAFAIKVAFKAAFRTIRAVDCIFAFCCVYIALKTASFTLEPIVVKPCPRMSTTVWSGWSSGVEVDSGLVKEEMMDAPAARPREA